MVYPAGMQGVLTVMGFHKSVVLGRAVISPSVLLWHAVIVASGCLLKRGTCNGLWGCLLWAVAVHLADVLWHLLGTFAICLRSLKCPVLLFLSQEEKLLGEMFGGVVEQP